MRSNQIAAIQRTPVVTQDLDTNDNDLDVNKSGAIWLRQTGARISNPFYPNPTPNTATPRPLQGLRTQVLIEKETKITQAFLIH